MHVIKLLCLQECIYETQSSILCNYGLWLVENKRLDLVCEHVLVSQVRSMHIC